MIEITKPKIEDAEQMQEVFYRTWLATYPNEEAGITVDDVEDQFNDRNSKEKLAKRRDWISNPSAGEHVFVAKEEGKIVGLCSVILHDDKNRLKTIYVLPEHQGKGAGTLLWQEAQKFLNPKKDTVLWVATYNANAIAFYKKLGFQESGNQRQNERKMKSGTHIPEMEMIKKADDEQQTD